MTNRNETIHLVLASLLNIRGVDANLLVVLLEGSEVLTRLGELTLLHTLTNVPVDEGALRVEEIELVVKSTPRGRDGGRVGKHAKAAGNLRQVTARDVRWWLVADAELEAGRAPVDELNGALGLDDGDSSVDVLGDDVTTVEKSTRHYKRQSGRSRATVQGTTDCICPREGRT